MSDKLKICVVTGTRAEYGILKSVIREIEASKKLKLQLVVTGSHLEKEFGHTVDEIIQDGFNIDDKLLLNLSSDSTVEITKAMGRAVVLFADSFEKLKPDIILVLGDRYEILAASQAALMAGIPLAHISGGDITEGAIDESIRHSITKMAHLHFVTNKRSFKRVMQLGENPENIFHTGNPSLDDIQSMNFMTKEELSTEINFNLCHQNILITFHPVTLEQGEARKQIYEILDALKNYPKVGKIFTMSNADPEGMVINKELEKFVKENENSALYASLGHRLYFNVLKNVDAVLGNSSSGLLEAPSFDLPCINIGDRQKGRMQAQHVINVPINKDDIIAAIEKTLSLGKIKVSNPYGDGNSSKKIVHELEKIVCPKDLLKKKFFDIEFD